MWRAPFAAVGLLVFGCSEPSVARPEQPRALTVELVPPPSASAAVREVTEVAGDANPPGVDRALHFRADESNAIVAARDQKRPMIVDFAAEWCGACKELEAKTFSDPRVLASGGRFVAVRVDATNEDSPPVAALMKKYRVTGLPTVVIVDSTGKEVNRVTEFINAEKFLAILAAVR